MRKKYPGRLNLPGEIELRQAISVLYNIQKQGKHVDLTKQKRGRAGMNERFVSWIENTLRTYYNSHDMDIAERMNSQ